MSKSNISVGNQGWIDRINAAWGKAATAYIDLGHLLIECKATVPHGDWAGLLDKLDFDKRTAQKLMEIARDPRLSNASHATLLPKHWTTLYELSKLPDAEFEKALNEGAITKNTQRSEVKRLRSPKAKFTDAEYHEVKESSPTGRAVSAVGVSDPHGVASDAEPTHGGAPQDGSEVGDKPVTWPDPERLDPFRVEDFTREGMVAYWVDQQDPMSMVVLVILLANRIRKEITTKDVVALWPADTPMLSDDLDMISFWIEDVARGYRAHYGNGNDAALQAAE